MPNKYCNLDGPTKIKDDYTKINDGFASVENDISVANTEHDNHVNGIAEKHTSDHIDNVSVVIGLTITAALNTLKGLIDDLDSVFSTDVERINAINQALTDAFGADDDLEASLLNVIAVVQAELTAHKNTDAQVHPSSKITFDKTGTNLVSTIVETVIKELNTKVDANKATGDANLVTHQNSSSAHGSSSITNQSTVTGAKVTDALNALKDSLAAIVANVTVDSEVILARNSGVKNVVYSTLDDRLEDAEKGIPDLTNHAVYQELMDSNGYIITDNVDDSLLGSNFLADIGDIISLRKDISNITIIINSIASLLIPSRLTYIETMISKLNEHALLDNTY